MSQGGLSFMRPFWASFIRPGGDGGFRRSSPLRESPPFSGANAGSTLRPRPGLRHMYSLVSVKTFSTHVVFIFRPIVRGKRFSTHGNLSYIRVEMQPKRPRFHSIIIKG